MFKENTPDILNCLANLSSDEVFTPPHIANKMLDRLPLDLWSNPQARFLDPMTKSGVFLREIAKRLLKGLEEEIPDLQKRIDHIFTKQLFGIAITHITGLVSRRTLYCSKEANSPFSATKCFSEKEGHILFPLRNHSWEKGKCSYCGSSEKIFDERDDLYENYAYPFIHTEKPEEFFKMKFDVIIGNPPYQMNSGGFGAQAKPLYHLFIEQAKKLNPRYLCMIIPARWYSGGMGLDAFRDMMLHDTHIKELHDFPNGNDCFPHNEIKGGVCFFLRDTEYDGLCTISQYDKEKIISQATRPLLEEGLETFIRYNEAISILDKVREATSNEQRATSNEQRATSNEQRATSNEQKYLNSRVSAMEPFGFPTNFYGKKEKMENAILLYHRKEKRNDRGYSYIPLESVKRNQELIQKHKIFVPKAGDGDSNFSKVIGMPFYGEPYSVCTATYLVAGAFDSKEEALNYLSYLKTKFVRFLIFLNRPTQDTLRKVYSYVPEQTYQEEWSDEKLYLKYHLTQKEITFIERMIRPME